MNATETDIDPKTELIIADVPRLLDVRIAQRDSGQWAYRFACAYGVESQETGWTGRAPDQATAVYEARQALEAFLPMTRLRGSAKEVDAHENGLKELRTNSGDAAKETDMARTAEIETPPQAEANGEAANREISEMSKRIDQLRAMGKEIQKKKRLLEKQQTKVAEVTAERKAAMELENSIQGSIDELHEELELLAVGKSSERLFPPSPTETEPEKQASDASAAAPGMNGDAWRAVVLSTLEPAIKPGKLKVLAAQEPPIVTIGDLVDFQAKVGDWWARNIKGLGDAGVEQIAAATDRYWAQNPRK